MVLPKSKPQRVPLGAREVTIIRRLKDVVKLPVTKIALAVDRNKTTVYEALDKKWKGLKRGRRDLLSSKDVNLLVRVTRAMIKKAAAKKEVTLAMIRKRAKIKAGEQTMRKALQQRGIRFRRMRSKPLLTKEDVKSRFHFSKKYRKKPKSFWRKKIDLYWDLKTFPVYGNDAARTVGAQRQVRGAYRELGKGLDESYVIIPKHLKYNTGVRALKIAGAVGKGRLRLWTDIGRKWNGKKAAELYLNQVRAALRKASPTKRSFLMLEDNDPTGFKSKLAEKAKTATKIKIFEIPKRSPDLSVMDYAIWAKINSTMRAQERRFKKSKKETRDQFAQRLAKVAKSLPTSFVDKAIGNMKERCERLYRAKGQHFEEGGKSMFVK